MECAGAERKRLRTVSMGQIRIALGRARACVFEPVCKRLGRGNQAYSLARVSGLAALGSEASAVLSESTASS